MDAAVFSISAVIAVVASLLVVTRKNPVYSAIWLVLFFLMMATDFLVLRSPFLAVIQVLIYGGAIMVLFLFVLMLLNQTPEELEEKVSRKRKIAAGLGSFALFLLLVGAIRGSSSIASYGDLTAPIDAALPAATAGEVRPIGWALFRDHVLAFELTSILIFVAIIGAIYLTKTRRAVDAEEQQDATASLELDAQATDLELAAQAVGEKP